MFSKKATKIQSLLDTYLVNVKARVKIWSIFAAFLENMNFTAAYALIVDGCTKEP